MPQLNEPKFRKKIARLYLEVRTIKSMTAEYGVSKDVCCVSGFRFYSMSECDFAELVNGPDHIAANFKSYIHCFFPNVSEILLSAGMICIRIRNSFLCFCPMWRSSGRYLEYLRRNPSKI